MLSIYTIITLFLWNICIFVMGRTIIKLIDIPMKNSCERVLLNYFLGHAFIAFIIMILGFCGLLKIQILWLTIFLLFFSSYLYWKYVSNDNFFINYPNNFLSTLQKFQDSNWLIKSQIYLIIVILFLNLIACFAPPSDADSVSYSLALPKYYVLINEIKFEPNYLSSGLPLFVEMFNIISLLHGSDNLSQLFQWCMNLAVGFSIYFFASTRLSNKVGLLCMVLYHLMPKIIVLSSTSKSDIAFFGYIIMSLHMLFYWKEKKEYKYFWLSSLFTGLSMSAKTQGLFWAISIGILVLIMLYQMYRNVPSKIVKLFISYSLMATVIVLPWYIRNYINTGDPIWPFGFPIFESKYWTQELHDKYSSWQQGSGVSFINYISGLWNLTLNQSDWIGGLRLPHISFQLALFPGILLFWKKLTLKEKTFIKYIFCPITIYYTLWFFTYQQSRYILPALILLLVPTVLVFYKMLKIKTLKYIALILLIFNFAFSSLYGFFFNTQFFPVVFGFENKNTFLDKKITFFKDIDWMNNNLPSNSKIFFNLLKPFYLNHNYIIPPSYMLDRFNQMNEIEFYDYLNKKKLTHIFQPGNAGNLFKDNLSRLLESKKIEIVYSSTSSKIITSRSLNKYNTISLIIYKVSKSD